MFNLNDLKNMIGDPTSLLGMAGNLGNLENLSNPTEMMQNLGINQSMFEQIQKGDFSALGGIISSLGEQKGEVVNGLLQNMNSLPFEENIKNQLSDFLKGLVK
jgi:hypothetical protein